jgi:dihydroorotate dehydrogenase (NAD+) catalytic subunit
VADALEFLIAGASTIGIGTALFYDPLVCKRINAGIAAHLSAHKLHGVADLVGSLRTGKEIQDTPCSG